ncbi:type IV pilus assembly protein PilW [Azomonas agilis]|uniref:Type IV pilus assembly protein PilW n=1 Tax=Azomonas agilis TaxID=116849 RepID=A0A562HZF3_9GAMM|nr:PilW family protein [Azomonas agilis]TWH64052.1 type IV pilus assembly protein PilW [Azomonas agilis]
MILGYRQKGLSLLELLVAMAISSFLILGVTQIYLDNRRSYSFQQNLSENQESSRYIQLMLHQHLTKAGYRREPYIDPELIFPSTNVFNECNFSKGQTVVGNGSFLCIRYQPRDTKDRNCLGNSPRNSSDIAAPYKTSNIEIIIERYYLTNNSLSCQVIHTDGSGATLENSSGSAELIRGLLDLHFEFGLGSDADTRSVHKYVTSPSGTDTILAVRYSILLRSTNTRLRDAVDFETAIANWKTLTGVSDTDITDDNGQLYQVTQRTVSLRNLLP